MNLIRRLLVFLILICLNTSLRAQSLPFGLIKKEFLVGYYDYTKDDDFVRVRPEHSGKLIYIKRDTYRAFIEMYNCAREEGIQLKIISGARNFDEQKKIWERKWAGLKDLNPLDRTNRILEFSSMPATSRHHWGTDIDLNNLENSYFESGKGKMEYEWLLKNARRYGFYQVYGSQNAGRTGYREEKWHWSYLPLAGPYLAFYNELVDYRDIKGFEGSHLAEINQMINNYVNGIEVFPEELVRAQMEWGVEFPSHLDGQIPEE